MSARRRISWPLAAVAASAATLAVPGCATGPDDDAPGLVRALLVPDQAYRDWWDEIGDCAGLQGDFDRLRFFEVVAPLFLNGSRFPCGGGDLCNGIWEPPHDITLAPAHLDSERLVKHEMLHDLLGVTGHPPVFETCDVTWDGGDPRSRPRGLPR